MLGYAKVKVFFFHSIMAKTPDLSQDGQVYTKMSGFYNPKIAGNDDHDDKVYPKMARFIPRWLGLSQDGQVHTKMAGFMPRWPGLSQDGWVYPKMAGFIPRWLGLF